MKKSASLIKIAGIEVFIHWTFSLIIIYIVYINLRAGLSLIQVGWSVLFVLSLFVCVVLHELGHALTAKRYGIKTRDITLYPIGGVARLEKMPEKPKHELLVAIAGPAVNIVISVLLLPFLLRLSEITAAAAETKQELIIDAHTFLPMLAVVNLWLALFNLIPAFPMDGGRVLRALMAMRTTRLKATQTAATIGKILAIGFVIAGFYLNPFLIFIGLFIILGAQAEAELVKTQFFISDLKAGDALMTNYKSLDKDQSIAEAVKALLDGEAKNFLVTADGKPFGVISRDHLIKGITTHGESAPLHTVADRDLSSVQRNTPLNDVFQVFQRTRNPIVLVREGEQVAGIIDVENIAEIIMIRDARQQPHHEMA